MRLSDSLFIHPSRLGLWNNRLHLFRGVTPPPNECAWYDTKLSDGEAPALELRGMKSTPSLPLLPGSLWNGESYQWVK